MATAQQEIQTIRTQTLALLKDVTLSPKPNYSVEGRSVSWGDYMKQLRDTIAWCDAMEASYDVPEVTTQGFT